MVVGSGFEAMSHPSRSVLFSASCQVYQFGQDFYKEIKRHQIPLVSSTHSESFFPSENLTILGIPPSSTLFQPAQSLPFQLGTFCRTSGRWPSFLKYWPQCLTLASFWPTLSFLTFVLWWANVRLLTALFIQLSEDWSHLFRFRPSCYLIDSSSRPSYHFDHRFGLQKFE